MPLRRGRRASSVRQAADILQVVGSAVELRAQGRRLLLRPLPVPRRAHRRPSTCGRSENTYYCFGCQAKGDVVLASSWRPRAWPSPRRSRSSPTASASSSSASRRTRTRPSAAGARSACSTLLDRACHVLRAHAVGLRRGRAGARAYLAERGLERGDAARRSASASRPRLGPASLAASRRGGLQRGGAHRRRPGRACARRLGPRLRPLPRAGSCSRWPTSAAACAGSARRAMARGPAAEVPELERGRDLPQGPPALRRRSRPAARRRARARSCSPRATPTCSPLHQAGVRNAPGSWARR